MSKKEIWEKHKLGLVMSMEDEREMNEGFDWDYVVDSNEDSFDAGFDSAMKICKEEK